jgi:hypothetical protein
VAGPTTTIPVRVDEVELQVEAARVAGSEQTARLGREQDAAAEAFDRVQDPIVVGGASSVATIGRFGARAIGPDGARVKVGLKFAAQSNVIVAGVIGEVSRKVSSTYERPPVSTLAGSSTPAAVATG